MNKFKQLLLASVLAASTTSAYALNDGSNYDWNRHIGTYADISIGTNAYYLGIVSSEGNKTRGSIRGAGWGAAVGYNFTHFFGLEGGFIQNYVQINDSAHLNTPYTTTRWTLPIGQRFSLFGKLGLMYPNVPQRGGLLLPFTGVGASYALTQHIDATLQYQGAVYGVVGAGLLGAGLTYHFD